MQTASAAGVPQAAASMQAPAKQQAHALVDRMTPLQISALIDLFESLTQNVSPVLSRAPFCDELPIDTDDANCFRALSGLRQSEQPPRIAAASAYPTDLDLWPAAGRSRSSFLRNPAA
jgi:hypothetical protein